MKFKKYLDIINNNVDNLRKKQSIYDNAIKNLENKRNKILEIENHGIEIDCDYYNNLITKDLLKLIEIYNSNFNLHIKIDWNVKLNNKNINQITIIPNTNIIFEPKSKKIIKIFFNQKILLGEIKNIFNGGNYINEYIIYDNYQDKLKEIILPKHFVKTDKKIFNYIYNRLKNKNNILVSAPYNIKKFFVFK